MKPPIVINESPQSELAGDLCVYGSVEWAQLAHEAHDAEDEDIRAFDSEGRLLKMVPLWETSSVRLEPAEDMPGHLEALTSLLRDFLLRVGIPKLQVEAMSIDEMLKAVYDRDPNPYSGYRAPGHVEPSFWGRLIARFSGPAKPQK